MAYSWRGCRGKAGHLLRQPVRGERGNRLELPFPAGLPGRRRAGSSSSDGSRAGRSPRSSPRSGKPATWQRGAASSQTWDRKTRRSPVNTGASWPSADEAEARVLEIQTKLHQWATDDPDRRFSDLDNLICDPAFLVVAWRRVRSNRGARTAGVDGETAYYVTAWRRRWRVRSGPRDRPPGPRGQLIRRAPARAVRPQRRASPAAPRLRGHDREGTRAAPGGLIHGIFWRVPGAAGGGGARPGDPTEGHLELTFFRTWIVNGAAQ